MFDSRRGCQKKRLAVASRFLIKFVRVSGDCIANEMLLNNDNFMKKLFWCKYMKKIFAIVIRMIYGDKDRLLPAVLFILRGVGNDKNQTIPTGNIRS